MGQAKRRGTFEQRKAESQENARRRLIEAEERERARYEQVCAEAAARGEEPPRRFPKRIGPSPLVMAAMAMAFSNLNHR